MRDFLIDRFKLQPHPEGGFYRETFRSEDRITRDSSELRSASTAIYYMLCDNAYSAWHRIRSDELWHFYAGDPILIHVIDGEGALQTHRLGNALVDSSADFQAIVQAGNWFAAELLNAISVDGADGYALAGCTVAPGFEFSEFELADTKRLSETYPAHAALISRLRPKSAA